MDFFILLYIGIGIMGAFNWITGLSGAGKTTIGKLLYKRGLQEICDAIFQTLRYVARTGDACNLLYDLYA